MEFNTDLYNKNDYEAIKILKDFLPDKIFDAHTHVFSSEATPIDSKSYDAPKCGVMDYKSFMLDFFPGAKIVRQNAIVHPDKTMSDISSGVLLKSDKLLFEELEKDSGNVGEIIVLPTESAEDIEKRLVHPAIKGFKCSM